MELLFKSHVRSGILFLFICVFVSTFLSALTLDDNIIIRNSGSKTGMTFSQEIEVSKVTIEENFILFNDIKYERDGLSVSIPELSAGWRDEDIDSNTFPYLMIDKDGLKEIISDIPQNLNATLSFTVRSCDDLENIHYKNDFGFSKTYDKDDFECGGNRVSLNVVELSGKGLVNRFSLSYTEDIVEFVRDIPLIRIPRNGRVSINLTDHFIGADNYSISVLNISTIIEGNILTFVPDVNFSGARSAIIIGYNQDNFLQNDSSNKFNILVSSGNLQVNTSRSQIKVGEKVSWKKNVSVDVVERFSVDLPKEAENVNVKKFKDGVEEAQASFSVISQEKADETEETGFFSNIFGDFLVLITGNVVSLDEPTDSVDVVIDDNANDYVIEYETPAPEKFEEEISDGKKVVISGPDDLNYTDVLSFTTIPEVLDVGKESEIKVIWVENSSEVLFDAYDLDFNGKLDYVEWITPFLSNQTFNIILITDASHLNSNRTFISNIFEEVRELDGNWSETIPDGDFVRVVFERNLTSDKDITIYPKATAGEPRIEIYEKNESILIAEFTDINSNQYNKVFLTNLIGEQDTFDLRIVGGSLEFDHIVDPDTTNPAISFVSPTPANDTTQQVKNITINVSIIEGNLAEVIYNWNGTNFTIYNDSLIAMYNFDNVSALKENNTHVVDMSEGGYNGTVSGGSTTITNTHFGIGRSMNFDGNNDFVKMGDVLDFDGTVPMAISLWVNVTSGQVNEMLVSKQQSGEPFRGYSVFHDSPSRIEFNLINGVSPSNRIATHGSTAIDDGIWHHVAVTYDGSQSVSGVAIYIDGVAESLTTNHNTLSATTSNTAPFNIGSRNNGNFPFDGLIDEVRIWNRSLSAAEVNQLYMTNLRKFDTDRWELYINQSKNSTAGLEEKTYTYFAYANDTNSNSNQTETRYFTVGAAAADTAPKWFDNSSNSTVTGANVLHSIRWTDDTALDGFIFSFANGTTNSFVNDTWVAMSSKSNHSNVTKFINNTIGSIIQWRVYSNDTAGNLNVTDIFNYITSGIPDINFTNPTPGNATSQTQTNVTINVSIIEENLAGVIYNWNATNFTIYDDSLVLMYNFDNVSALKENDTHVVDMSRSGDDNGTVFGGNNTVVNGKYQRAMQFQGSDDYVLVNSTPVTAAPFTICAWINMDQLPASAGDEFNIAFIHQSGQGSGWRGWNFRVDDSNNGQLQMNVKESGGQNGVTGNTQMAIKTWNFVCAVERASNDRELFLNGVSDGTNTGSRTPTGVDRVFIGAFQFSSIIDFFDGLIDEVRIWNRGLSAAEINQEYMTNLRKFDTDKWELYINQTKNSTAGLDEKTYTYFTYANDTSSNSNQTETRYITIGAAATDTIPPQWFDNSSNNTVVSSNVLHSVRWTDDTALSGYIFSFDNGTGSFVNDSFVVMTGANNWSNVSKVVNSTGGATIQWKVYANDSSNNLNVTDIFNYTTTVGISILLSVNLSTGILWDIQNLPSINQSADGNNDDANSITTYFINISSEGTNVDLYVQANGDLLSSGGDIIGLGNETYSYNTTNSSVPSSNKFSITTNYSDNKIGDNLADGSAVYLKFFLNVLSAQPAGSYNNSLSFKAVETGQSP